MKKFITHMFAAFVTAALAASLTAQTDTTFTYQGTLNDVGSPANGDYSMRFLLYDARAGGTQIGSTVTIASQSVTDGLFTTNLDFGADAFDNTGRWLAIVVNGTTLSPRQSITRSPYSIQTRGMFIGDDGNVLFHSLSSVEGTMTISSLGGIDVILDADTNNQSEDQNAQIVMKQDGGQVVGRMGYREATNQLEIMQEWNDNLVLGTNNQDRLTIDPDGNVGIGTTTPQFPLEVVRNGGTAIRAFGSIYGVWGQSDSFSGTGVRGLHSSTNGSAPGVLGETDSNSHTAIGVHGRVNSISSGVVSTGVRGENLGTGVSGLGVFGSHEGGGQGVFGRSESGIGVLGRSFGPDGMGVYGHHFALSGIASGVLGDTNSNSNNAVGVHGLVSSTSPGTFSAAVRGENMGTGAAGIGVWGSQNGNGWGVFGQSLASSGSGIGVRGEAISIDGFDFFAAGAGTNYGASSSIRWKSNIRNIDQPLEKIARLRGVYYDWDEEHGGAHDVGMIAEEVGAVMPEIVQYEENGIDAIGMDYSKMTPLLVEAVNALRLDKDAEIAAQAMRLTKLERKNANLSDANAELQNRLDSLEQLVEQLASTAKERLK